MHGNLSLPRLLLALPLLVGPGRPYVPPRVIVEPGRHVHRVPRGAVSVSFGDSSFFFYAGIFYQWRLSDYVVVTAPIGVLVPVLPSGCAVEAIAGRPYYVLHGVYYRPTRGGY